MAKAKAKAKAPAKRAPRSNGKATNSLPSGFQAVEGFAKPWDVDAMPVLQGTWGKVRVIQVKRGKKLEDARVCDIETEDGRFTVWESAGLMTAFDEISEGDEVYLRFDGYGTAKKGQNAPKLYTIGYK